jgi:hypothetical protein
MLTVIINFHISFFSIEISYFLVHDKLGNSTAEIAGNFYAGECLLYFSLIINDLIFHFLNSDLILFFVEAGLFVKILGICTKGEISIYLKKLFRSHKQ